MKKLISLLFVLFSGYMSVQSQNNFFDPSKPMPVGAYYYPEHWSENEWERDLKKMSEMGFKFTHFAEFAWSRLEPTEGNYDFSWLDKSLALADKYHLKVIMCTPSACPPAWLSTKYPEVLAVKENGRQIVHSGGRLTGSITNPKYQEYVTKIVTEMAKHYAQDKRIWGWQVGNEPHIEGHYDYSVSAESNFRSWLQSKYKNVDKLNEAWGAAFWSYTFNNFDQVKIPNQNISDFNPHALLDFQLFSSQTVAASLKLESDILRKNISATQFITTNFAYWKFLPEINPFLNKKDFDFSSYTMYLLSTYLNTDKGNLSHRLGSGLEISYSNEFTKSVQGQTGIMELQPGQINWGAWNSQPLPGAVKMWLWHNWALDSRFVCTYRFRQPAYGSELYHKGIMETDGLKVSPGGAEYVDFIKDLDKIKTSSKSSFPKEYLARKAVMLWKSHNFLDMKNMPHTNQFDYFQHYYKYYASFKSCGAPVEFKEETEVLDPIKNPLVVGAAHQLVEKNIIENWKKYVEAGGNLVLSCRSGQKNDNGHLWRGLTAEPIHSLIGAKIEYFDQLPADRPAQVLMDTKIFEWNSWGDILAPMANTEVWATYNDQFYKGTAAVTHRKLGKGTITYIGVDSKDGLLENEVIHKLYQKLNINVLNQIPYVFTEYRNEYGVTVNYSSETIEAPTKGIIISGSKTVKPGGYVVWKE